MPRPIWKGAISFGLVNVPVAMHAAVRRKTVRFNQLNAETGARIAQRRVDSGTGEEVPYEQIVKGYEVSPDRYVVIEPEELEALEPEKTKTIEIEDFVELGQIDPLFYDHSYYLTPDAGGAKSYKLLHEAMRATGRVGIARVVIRSREQLVALRPLDDGLLGIATMVFADEIVDPTKLDGLPDKDVKTAKRELDVAKQLIDAMAGDFEPERYHDAYREQVLELIEDKAQGKEIAVQPAAEEKPGTPAPDLIAALRESLDARSPKGGGRKAANGGDRAPAKGSKASKSSRASKGRARAKSS